MTTQITLHADITVSRYRSDITLLRRHHITMAISRCYGDGDTTQRSGSRLRSQIRLPSDTTQSQDPPASFPPPARVATVQRFVSRRQRHVPSCTTIDPIPLYAQVCVLYPHRVYMHHYTSISIEYASLCTRVLLPP